MPALKRPKIVDSYLQLITEFPLRRIKTAPEHSRAVKMVLRFSFQKHDDGAEAYLDVLVDLIADYETRAGQAIDISRVSAADLVRHRIQERGRSVSSLARLIGMPQSNLSEMLGGKRIGAKPRFGDYR